MTFLEVLDGGGSEKTSMTASERQRKGERNKVIG
jgi:hypothetical protein